jgi:TonB family protein
MNSLILFLIKVTAGTTLLYLCYLLFFSKETFYLRNRILLILTLVIPVFLPFLKVPVQMETAIPSPIFYINNLIIPTQIYDTEVSQVTQEPFDYIKLLISVYFVVTSLMLLKVLISIISTLTIIKGGTIKQNSFPRVVVTPKKVPPFSFFPFVVIPQVNYESGNYNDILWHESAHVRQGHTFDLILCEIFIAFQWANPFLWFIRRSLVLNHEYLADNFSIQKGESLKEYQFKLLSFQTGIKHISIAHNFNSLIKNRIIMINQKPTRKIAAIKTLIVLPVVAVVIYAFGKPENSGAELKNGGLSTGQVSSLTIYRDETGIPGKAETRTITGNFFQKVAKGVVKDANGKPIAGVNIRTTTTGINVDRFPEVTGSDGHFTISDLEKDATLIISATGFKDKQVKPEYDKEMVIVMDKDPNYKGTQINSAPNSSSRRGDIVSIDGIITEKDFQTARKDLGYNFGTMNVLDGEAATTKYGEKGKYGVIEIITRKKALQMGLHPAFPRLAPEDYPTFRNKNYSEFNTWVVENVKYPAEAQTKKAEGWVGVRIRIDLDGTLNVMETTIPADPILSDAVIKTIKASPKWSSPKNSNVDEPFTTEITVKFVLPNLIKNESTPYVVVEKMPSFPGGDAELLRIIAKNIKYPESAKAEKISGRVIVRFIVSETGKVEAPSIMKGVDPRLDAAALEAVLSLPLFTPGTQNGKPVNVWYMVPITFTIKEDGITK